MLASCLAALVAIASGAGGESVGAPAAAGEQAPVAKKRLQLGALPFSSANVTPEVTNVASEHFAQQLALQGFRVLTSSEISAVLGLERQKQLLGCGDEAGCVVELSNALGVDAVVLGSLGSFGGRFTVNVKVIGARDGAQLALFSATAEAERGLPDVLSRGAQDVARQVKVSLGLEAAPPPSVVVVRQGLSLRQKWALAPTALAVVSFVLAGAEFGLATGNKLALERLTYQASTFDRDLPLAVRLRNDADMMRLWGWIFLGTGTAAVGGAAWLFFSGAAPPPVQASVGLGPGGGSVTVWGQLPW